MIKKVCCLLLLIAHVAKANLSIENESDRQLFVETKVLASQLLSKSPKDELGNTLLKVADWMNGKDAEIKDMKFKVVFRDKVTALEGDISKEGLAGKYLKRQQALIVDVSKRLLYISVANKLDPQQSKTVFEEFSKFDMSIPKLISDTPKPKLVDLDKVAEEMAQIEEENRLLDSSEKSNDSEIDLILDGVVMESFSYSEASVIQAINTLTHNLYWRGCQMRISGKRLHFTKTIKSTAGAVFYVSPMPLPVKETYTLKNKTIRQILEHMAMNLKVLWQVEEGGVHFYDSMDKSLIDKPSAGEDGETVAVTSEGIAANQLQEVMRNMKLSDLKKYRGKVLEINGQITGFGRGFGTEYYISLDGGKTRLNFHEDAADAKIFKRLKMRVEKWKAAGGLKTMREKLRELEQNAEDVNRSTLSDPTLFVQFKALCYSVDRGRLIFKDPEFAFIKATGEYLIKSEAPEQAATQ